MLSPHSVPHSVEFFFIFFPPPSDCSVCFFFSLSFSLSLYLSLFSVLILGNCPRNFAVDFMGGDAKCVQHKIVLPMYVSYTSIPTSTANTTMKSTKLLTNPYLDVTTTSTTAATYNLNKSINDHKQSTNNRNSMHNKNSKPGGTNNTEINMSINGMGGEIGGEKTTAATNLYSMSFNPYKSGANNDEFDDCTTTKKLMTNPMRSLNTAGHVHKRNGVVYRNKPNKLYGIANGYPNPRAIRYSDSDDTRSSSIDYNFNYVKFRSPLNAAGSSGVNGKLLASYRDCSTTTTLATECSDKRHSLILPKVHNHPNCQCAVQNYCPFAERFDKPINQLAIGNFGLNDRKCYAPRYPYRRRDSNTNAFDYDAKMHESPPEYDHIDDFLMKRTFSHDRLFSQRRITAVRNSTRPKSYCSNVNHNPTQL